MYSVFWVFFIKSSCFPRLLVLLSILFPSGIWNGYWYCSAWWHQKGSWASQLYKCGLECNCWATEPAQCQNWFQKASFQKGYSKFQYKTLFVFCRKYFETIVKLDTIPTSIVESLPKPKSPNDDLLQKISEQIKDIDKRKALACLDKTCQQKVDSTSSSSEEKEVASSNSDSEEVIATIQKTFEEEPIQNTDKQEPLALNKIQKWSNVRTRNYYPRRTPPDIQYEDRGQFKDRSFDVRSIYGWNIDGKSEHEVLSTIEDMGVAAAAFKVNEYANRDAATIIVLGFSG